MSDTASLLWKAVSPVFITMGTFGNVLCITVLMQPSNRKSSTAVFLTALAISDLFVLYTGLLRWWLIHLIHVDVRHLGDAICKIHWFLIFASTETSSWLLVAVTCERIISTKWPHKVKALCTPRSATYTVLLIAFIIYGGSAHLLYGMGLRLEDRPEECVAPLRDNCITEGGLLGNVSFNCNCTDAALNGSNSSMHMESDVEKYSCSAYSDKSYKSFFNFVYPWMDLVLYFLIPAVILGIGDVIIIHKIISSRKLRMSMMFLNKVQSKHISDKSLSITVMLLTVNAVFILCTTPVSIYLIGFPYWVDVNIGFTRSQEIAWAAVNLLMYLNHSINFLLYFLSGSRFRRKVYDTFRKRRSTNSYPNSSAGSQSGSFNVCEHPSPYKQCSVRASKYTRRSSGRRATKPNDDFELKTEATDSVYAFSNFQYGNETSFVNGVHQENT